MAALILPIEAILPHAARPFGVKARTLSALARGGFPVPAAFALSSEAAWRHYRQVLPDALQPEQLFTRRMVDPEQLQRACQCILSGPLELETVDALAGATRGLGGLSSPGLAVRASSTAHNADTVSASRLHTATLDVHTVRGLHDAVRGAWAAMFRPEVFGHAGRLWREGGGAPGVVVQAIVPAQVSGSLFTAHPLTADPDEMLLNAFEGPGGDRDDGDLSPDTYRIDKATGFLRDRVLSSGSRRALATLDARGRQVLDEHMLGRLIELGVAVQAHLGAPRRIGWAVDGDRLYVLDARELFIDAGHPTRIAQPRRRSRPQRRQEVDTVWSNAFLGELVPDVASPLTWSLLRDFGHHGLREAFETLGCRSPGRSELIANYRGRGYVNLSEFLQLASRVPGLRAGVELRGGGPGEQERLLRSVAAQGDLRAQLALPRALSRFASQQLTLSAEVGRFVSTFRAETERMGGVDVRVLPGAALDDTLSDAHRLLDRTAELTLRAHAGLLACVTPMRVALRSALGEQAADALWPALLSTGEPWQHAELVRDVARVGDALRRDVAARDALLAGRAQRPEQLPPGPARATFVGLLQRIGHRAPHGAELAHPRFSEDPQLLLRALSLQLASPLQDPLARCAARARACREQALGTLQRVPLGRRLWVQQLQALARRYVGLRQRMLACLAEALGFFRLVAVDASRRMQIREPACGEGGALLLTLPELHDALRGDLDTLSPLIAMRRAQLARERALPAPPDSFVGYPRPVPEPSEPLLSGMPASLGQVEASVRVVAGPDDLAAIEPGEVLVMVSVDAGWAPLLTTAAALITERGSPLSTASFTARDLGLPSVVQVRGACTRLRSGQTARVDGELGTVQLI